MSTSPPTIAALVAALLFLSGCSILQPAVERSANAVVKGVTTYCKEVPQNQRAEFRERVNSQMPHSIAVACQGD